MSTRPRVGSTRSGSQLTREVDRLGSTAARLKLKGIDGGPHKQRSVRFNSTQRAEPYQALTWRCKRTETCDLRGPATGAAWLSSARAVRCWVKSRNERNPRRQLPLSAGTAGPNPEEGGDDVKSARPLHPGLHTRYNGRSRGQPRREPEPIPESRPQCRWQAATRLPEGGVASNRRSAHGGEYVPGPCTHRPSRHGSGQHLKSLSQPEPAGLGGRCRGWGW